MTERIVIVGGGAGGLELATQLGRKLGSRGKALITLIDRNKTHLWKPLLHEVAAGSLDSGLDELDYRGHAARHHFEFRLGELESLDREQQQVVLAPLHDDDGDEILHRRQIPYDRLVLAVGGVTHDFGIAGVDKHCYFLDSVQQAELFHSKLVNQFLKVNQQIEQSADASLRIAIVGGGATGVELAAELLHSVELLSVYGLHNLDTSHLKVTLLEAGPRILGGLPERLSIAASAQLKELGVEIICNMPVIAAEEDFLMLQNQQRVDADIMVWAAGVKAPQFLSELGLKTRKNNQIEVNKFLHSEDERIYAIGDCAACMINEKQLAPPRAQTAHQMANTLYRNIVRETKGRKAKPFIYKDRGSLISLSRFNAVGNLMGSRSLSMSLEGRLARLAYASLYRMHQQALHGWWRLALLIAIDKVSHALRPRLKLH